MLAEKLFKFQKGNLIMVQDDYGEAPISGVITGCFYELGKVGYDYIDSYGNFRWCYEEQIAN